MKILFFYPENPLLLTQGNNARALKLLEYFKKQNFDVDFIAQESHDKRLFNEEHLKELKEKKLIKNGFFLKRRKRSGINYLLVSLTKKMKSLFENYIPDFDRIRIGQEKDFYNITKDNAYDYIIISYAYNQKLLNNFDKKNAVTIVDTHDFLTAQFQNNKNFKLGKFFEKEISLLNTFDVVWAISIEETYLFSQFLNSKTMLVPHFLKQNKIAPKVSKSIDLLYVAGDNAHNQKSAIWFFEKVFSKLSNNINITVVGKITNYISDYDNLTKINYVESLEEVYSKSKVVICPMLSGTGLKIKVVEALSHNLPVVCSIRGVDGLLNKTNNGCLIARDEKEFVEHINNLLYNDVFYENLSKLAKVFFEESLSENVIYKQLNSFFSKHA